MNLKEESKNLMEVIVGPGYIETPFYLENAALLLERDGAYEEAGILRRRALQLLEENKEKDNIAITHSLTNIGNLMEFKGDFEGAEEFYRKCLELV